MKRILIAVFMVFMLGCTTYEKPENRFVHGDNPYYIRIDGSLYKWTGGESHRDFYIQNGMIRSYVEPDEVPEIDDQSNYGCDVSYSIIDDDRIDVYVHGHWWVHMKVKEKSAESESSKK